MERRCEVGKRLPYSHLVLVPGSGNYGEHWGPGWDLSSLPPPLSWTWMCGTKWYGWILRAMCGFGRVRTRPLSLSLHPGLSTSAFTSEPAQKEIIIRIGQGRQHVLDIFSKLGREMLVKVVFTLSLGPRLNGDIDHWMGR